MRFSSRWVVCLCFGLCLSAGAVAGLELQTKRGSDDDLALTGPLGSIPAGETRYITRAELMALPGFIHRHEKLLPSFAEADLGVLPLSALLAALPPGPDQDGLMLVCSDRWQSVLPLSFVKSYEPFLLLTYDGRTPAQGWPRFSAVEGLAPYFVSVSSVAHPKFNGVIDEGMISATQAVELRAVNVQRHYAPFYEGALASLSPRAAAGRKVFIRECNNCHQGPGGVGGNTSQRPLLLLQTHAALNEDFFRKMVRRPKDFYPNTVMPPHEYFDEETFATLIAFLRESRERMAATAAAPDPSIIPKYEKINLDRKLLTPEEIEAALARLPGWKAEGGRLTKTFVRRNFTEAIAFIDALAPECERLDHHPEIFTVYNKVSLTLTTFDAGQKISSFDVLLAERIEAVANPGKMP